MHAPTPGRIHVTYTIAMTNSAAATATRAVSTGVLWLRLVASQDCWVEYRAGQVAPSNGATPSGFFLPAGYVEILEVHAGETVKAICDTSSTGNLNVSEITR